MKKPKLTITIEGETGSGKTMLAKEIEKYLNQIGAEYKYKREDQIDIYERITGMPARSKATIPHEIPSKSERTFTI